LLPSFLLIACGEEESTACNPVTPADSCHTLDPLQRGPLAVGVTRVELFDPARLDALGNPRRLEVEIWYPAVPSARNMPRDGFVMVDEASPEAAALLPGIETLDPWANDAARDAEPEGAFAPYPLVTFSHGFGGARFQNTSLVAHLASHGYIVIAPDHTGNTLWDVVEAQGTVDPALTIEMLFLRAGDLSFLADSVASLPLGLGGLVDVGHWGSVGHSFGGSTSIGIAAARGELYDDRVSVSVPITPVTQVMELMFAGTDEVHVPMLMLAAHNDKTVDYASEQLRGYEIGNAPKALVAAYNAGHFTFTDLCSFDPDMVRQVGNTTGASALDDGCSALDVPVPVARKIERWAITGFLNHHLRGSPAAAGTFEPTAIPAALASEIEVLTTGL